MTFAYARIFATSAPSAGTVMTASNDAEPEATNLNPPARSRGLADWAQYCWEGCAPAIIACGGLGLVFGVLFGIGGAPITLTVFVPILGFVMPLGFMTLEYFGIING